MPASESSAAVAAVVSAAVTTVGAWNPTPGGPGVRERRSGRPTNAAKRMTPSAVVSDQAATGTTTRGSGPSDEGPIAAAGGGVRHAPPAAGPSGPSGPPRHGGIAGPPTATAPGEVVGRSPDVEEPPAPPSPGPTITLDAPGTSAVDVGACGSGVGSGVARGVGGGVALAVGAGVGFGVGFGVGLGVGFGVGAAIAT